MLFYQVLNENNKIKTLNILILQIFSNIVIIVLWNNVVFREGAFLLINETKLVRFKKSYLKLISRFKNDFF